MFGIVVTFLTMLIRFLEGQFKCLELSYALNNVNTFSRGSVQVLGDVAILLTTSIRFLI